MVSLYLLPFIILSISSFKFFLFLMVLEFMMFGIIVKMMNGIIVTPSILLFFMTVTAAEAAIALSLLMFSVRSGSQLSKMSVCEGS